MEILGKIALFFSGVIVCRLVQKIFKPVELPAKILDIQIGWGKAIITYELPKGEIITSKLPDSSVLESNINVGDIVLISINPIKIRIIGIMAD